MDPISIGSIKLYSLANFTASKTCLSSAAATAIFLGPFLAAFSINSLKSLILSLILRPRID